MILLTGKLLKMIDFHKTYAYAESMIKNNDMENLISILKSNIDFRHKKVFIGAVGDNCLIYSPELKQVLEKLKKDKNLETIVNMVFESEDI